MGREAREETDPIPVGGPIAPENIAVPSEPEDENDETDDDETDDDETDDDETDDDEGEEDDEDDSA